MRVPDPEKIVEKISEANHMYSENITLHRITKTPCASCYDPILKESTDINCPDCGGSGYSETDDTLTIPVGVSRNVGDIELLGVGTYFSEELVVTIDKQELDQHNTRDRFHNLPR